MNPLRAFDLTADAWPDDDPPEDEYDPDDPEEAALTDYKAERDERDDRY